MALNIKVLALDQLGNDTGMVTARTLYKPAASPVSKSAVVKALRFTNIAASGTVKLNVYFVPNGSTYPTNARRILPKDQLVPSGYEIIEDAEITLGSGDSLYAVVDTTGISNPPATGAWIHFVVSGLERDSS